MDNPLVTPELGLIVWTTLVFCILFFLLAKFAWKPILKAVKDRESSIEDALNAAEEATRKMSELKSDNEALLNKARAERDAMLKEARDVKDKIIAEAKANANVEGEKIIAAAKESINLEKLAAITELKNQVATLSIEIAEKILKEELSSADKQKAIIDNVVKDINLN
ncbi:F0F1 ATP synthase subunit B [Vicingus serpentipes]|jgi:F-type H+-transporting ATPase subunit b|uniref:ATP synthase subunit b n=1 Tax=Vicingus serpentipes TaxID=1926625 RepID=A0A5C6RQW3_9FLAO|nr:F0F1 ATP synthase subunit B [Vicingus serpentipes]TXB64334.1 F0F1 ATP synthase subunit B [Vicingus serpentipes]